MGLYLCTPKSVRARTFLLFWVAGTLGVLAYAGLDLTMNPGLALEQSFSMKPDWNRVVDLQHWGGRLIHHGAWPLLVANAFILGGLVALAFSTLWQLAKGTKDRVERLGFYDEDCPDTLRSARGSDLE